MVAVLNQYSATLEWAWRRSERDTAIGNESTAILKEHGQAHLGTVPLMPAGRSEGGGR